VSDLGVGQGLSRGFERQFVIISDEQAGAQSVSMTINKRL
jgi:hypothetical protein